MGSVDLKQELTSVVSALRTHLQWQLDHGRGWAPGGPTPRSNKQGPTDQSIGEEEGEAPKTSPQVSPAGREPAALTDLDQLGQQMAECRACGLYQTRKNLVFGDGDPQADLMFIGEAPGGDEDAQGLPFVGAAGQLLSRMIKAMGLKREEVYICNILKCRPPRNRNPEPEEIAACEGTLQRQIEIIKPRIILALGGVATKHLLRTDVGITRLRGRFSTYHGVPLMPTFHPAYLLRNSGAKREAWSDLQQVMAEMDRLVLKRRQ